MGLSSFWDVCGWFGGLYGWWCFEDTREAGVAGKGRWRKLGIGGRVETGRRWGESGKLGFRNETEHII